MTLMDDAELRARTKQTSQMLFHTLKGGSPFETWKKFDKGLARELSLFFSGVLFQMVTYGGMPVVVDALEVYAEVLAERGEPFPAEEASR